MPRIHNASLVREATHEQLIGNRTLVYMNLPWLVSSCRALMLLSQKGLNPQHRKTHPASPTEASFKEGVEGHRILLATRQTAVCSVNKRAGQWGFNCSHSLRICSVIPNIGWKTCVWGNLEDAKRSAERLEPFSSPGKTWPDFRRPASPLFLTSVGVRCKNNLIPT